MRHDLYLACCLVAAGVFTGCTFENDEVYVPRASAAYLVIQPPGLAPTRLGVIDAGSNSYTPDGTTIGLPAQPVSVAALGQALYITAGGRLIARDGVTRGPLSDIALEAGVTAIQPTDNGVFVLSPNQQRVWAVLLDGESDRTIPLPFQPQTVVAIAGKLLVASATGEAAWVSEQGLTLIRTTTAPANTYRIARNNIGRLEVLARSGSSLLRATANPGTESVGPASALTDTRDVWVSPNVRQQYGREYLGNIRWRADSNIVDAQNVVLLTRASSLYVDFDQSYLYATARDSLHRIDLVSRRRIAAWPETGQIVAGAAITIRAED